MSAAWKAPRLVSAKQAAEMVGLDEKTIRSWVNRGYLAPVAQIRDGRHLSNWYLLRHVLDCAAERLSPAKKAEIADIWAEVDALLAKAQVNCNSVA